MRGSDFVLNRVHSLLSHYAKTRKELRPPVDPDELATLCGVLSIEHHPMIPEGVLESLTGGFKIHVRSNFTRGMRTRARFTIAHELVHTFFYEQNDGLPKPLKGSPSGERLERLCHIGAGQILVPEPLLRKQLDATGEITDVQRILELAKLFDVSLEVMMRRLRDIGGVTGERFAAVLVHSNDREREIRAACYGAVLTSIVCAPRPGMDFDSWVLPLMPPGAKITDSTWVHDTSSARVASERVPVSNRWFLLALRFERTKAAPV